MSTREPPPPPPSTRALEAELAAVLRPPAKVASRRDEWSRLATSRFRAMVDYAVAEGRSFRGLARDADITIRHLLDCYEGRRNVPAWLFEAMPVSSRAEGVRVEIAALRKVG